MRTLSVLAQLLLLTSNAHSLSLRKWNIWEIISCHERATPSSPATSKAEHSIHRIYDPPNKLQTSLLPNSQRPLQPHHDDVHNLNQFNPGAVKMLSTAGHIVPISFTLSHAVCPIGTETLRMIHELGEWVLASHPDNIIKKNQTVQETVRLLSKRTEYRATLSLTMDRDMESGPFLGLVKLLKRTTEVLFVDIGEKGFGTLMEKGEFEGVRFVAFWTWYEIFDGVARRCEGGERERS